MWQDLKLLFNSEGSAADSAQGVSMTLPSPSIFHSRVISSSSEDPGVSQCFQGLGGSCGSPWQGQDMSCKEHS